MTRCYRLNAMEQALTELMATERDAAAAAAGATVTAECVMKGGRDQHEVKRNGLGAELAFCRLVNVYPDISINHRNGGHDCVWQGLRVDVKSSPNSNSRLLVHAERYDPRTQLYVLVHESWPTYTVLGAARSEVLIRPDRLVQARFSRCYAMNQSELEPIL